MRGNRLMRDERGIAMVYVMLVMMVMSSIAFVTLESIQHEQTTSYSQTNKQSAYQAAEAGIDDYTAKLNDDPQYYGHYVTAAESTRRDIPTSTNVAASGSCTATSKPTSPAWPYASNLAAATGPYAKGDPEWIYPNGKDRWCQTANGYEYNLQITPPTAAVPNLTILSTGRKTGATNTKDYRVIQSVLSPNNITRYYRIVNTSVAFANVTTTNGLVFANQNITHYGTATANLYAGGSINISPQSPGIGLTNGATANPGQPTINFSSFLSSFTDIARAASTNSPSTNFPTVANRDVWRFVFTNNGKFTAQTCKKNGGANVYDVFPICDAATTYDVPTNGAIYSDMDAMVSGQVKGRVTVASYGPTSIIVEGPLNPYVAGTDVIGLNALNDIVLADYVVGSGQDLTWSAAVIAQTGTWRDTSGTTHDVLTFRGMAVTDDGGSFGTFPGAHDFGYDTNLKFLTPPWFPKLGNPWVQSLFRELPPT